jgi:asparagine synthase (glutamine-hydrolysing)
MCGIWAFFGKRHEKDRLIDISHRGPDDHGRECFRCGDRELELASWRLSILDLSSHGHQPMSYANSRFQIVFNGEIYNHVELRIELTQAGYNFESHGDTEVILAAYAHWGEECLSRFLGMFAFCLWDRERDLLFVARDRFGIKPLYYFISERGIAFASEIKQFTGLNDFRARANPRRIAEFLAYGFQDHTSETLFHEVWQLRGGECAVLSTRQWQPGHQLSVRAWYELKAPTQFEGSFEEAAAKYRELFTDVIRLHLRSDVPVGSCLSGGMDSSAIVCATHKLLEEAGKSEIQKTFSCVFEQPECDERPFMEAVESSTKAKPHHVSPTPEDALAELSTQLWHQDEPFGDASVVAQWHLFRRVSQSGVKVMLDGQGGDEQLASYLAFFGPHLLSLLRWRGLPSMLQEARDCKRLHGWTMAKTIHSLLFWFAPNVFNLLGHLKRTWSGDRGWMKRGYLDEHHIRLNPGINAGGAGTSSISTSWLSRTMLTRTTLPMLLHWEDRNSMAHSVEARVPFLDHRLVEFSLSLPDEFKTRNGVTKRILKSAMVNVVPEKVLSRTDKKGFATPAERWLRDDSRGEFRQRLLRTANEHPTLLSVEGLTAELDAVVARRKAFSNVFWRIITFGAWAERFSVEI